MTNLPRALPSLLTLGEQAGEHYTSTRDRHDHLPLPASAIIQVKVLLIQWKVEVVEGEAVRVLTEERLLSSSGSSRGRVGKIILFFSNSFFVLEFQV